MDFGYEGREKHSKNKEKWFAFSHYSFIHFDFLTKRHLKYSFSWNKDVQTAVRLQCKNIYTIYTMLENPSGSLGKPTGTLKVK